MVNRGTRLARKGGRAAKAYGGLAVDAPHDSCGFGEEVLALQDGTISFTAPPELGAPGPEVTLPAYQHAGKGLWAAVWYLKQLDGWKAARKEAAGSWRTGNRLHQAMHVRAHNQKSSPREPRGERS